MILKIQLIEHPHEQQNPVFDSDWKPGFYKDQTGRPVCVLTARLRGAQTRAAELSPEQMAPSQCTSVMVKTMLFISDYFELEFQILYLYRRLIFKKLFLVIQCCRK